MILASAKLLIWSQARLPAQHLLIYTELHLYGVRLCTTAPPTAQLCLATPGSGMSVRRCKQAAAMHLLGLAQPGREHLVVLALVVGVLHEALCRSAWTAPWSPWCAPSPCAPCLSSSPRCFRSCAPSQRHVSTVATWPKQLICTLLDLTCKAPQQRPQACEVLVAQCSEHKPRLIKGY